MGEPKLGSTVPRLTPGLFAACKGPRCPLHDHGRCIFLRVCGFPFAAGGALCRRCRVGAAVAAEQSGQWGVSDPDLAAPFFAPRPARKGSLTPHMHVTIIRRDGAMPVTPLNAAPVSSAVRTSFAFTARARLSGSSGKLRSYR